MLTPDEQREVAVARSKLLPRHALGAFLLAILFSMVAPGIVVGVLGIPNHPLSLIATLQLSVLGAALVTLRSGRVSFTQAIPQRLPNTGTVVGSVILGAGVFGVTASTIGRLYETLDGGYTEIVGRMFEDVLAIVGPVGLLVLVGMVAPFCEEVLFRGVILQALLSRWSKLTAVVVSSILFAVFHFHPVHALVALFAGLASAVAVVVTGSIWPAILVHMSNNSVAATGAMTAADLEYLPVWFAVPSIFLALGGILLMRRAAASVRGSAT